jgi:hypothetical protein
MKAALAERAERRRVVVGGRGARRDVAGQRKVGGLNPWVLSWPAGERRRLALAASQKEVIREFRLYEWAALTARRGL